MLKKDLKRQLEVQKELTTHYQELFETAVKELKFKNMIVEMLENELEFIQTATNDELVKKTIDCVLARKMVDYLFHNRKIWETCDGLKTKTS